MKGGAEIQESGKEATDTHTSETRHKAYWPVWLPGVRLPADSIRQGSSLCGWYCTAFQQLA